MKKSEDNLIDRTLEVWQPRNAQRLSDEDARAILDNVKGFFTLLLEWETNEPVSYTHLTLPTICSV